MQEVDEFIIGLPISDDGKETTQSNKIRSVAGRLAVRAAERWEFYPFDSLFPRRRVIQSSQESSLSGLRNFETRI